MAVTINGSTGVAVPLGTVSAPGVSNTASATTGIYNPTSTTLGLSTNGTNAVTIDASQNVGIGTTSPSSFGKLAVIAASGNQISFGDSSASATNNGYLNYAGGSGALVLNAYSTGGSTYQAFYTSISGTNAERMRIDTSGNLLVGNTSAVANNGKIQTTATSTATGIGVFGGPTRGNYTSSDASLTDYFTFGRDNQITGNFVFYKNAASISYITAATGAYVATSDARVKKDIEDSQYGLAEVLKLRPVTYRMKTEDDTAKKHVGFIAQEVKAVVDNLVDDTLSEDQLYGLDKSGIVPLLVKAIQELSAEVKALKAKVGA
jgi:hypothetical protein